VINNLSKLQNTFHDEITTFMNGALFTRSDVLLSFFFPFIPFIRHAQQIARNYQQLRNKIFIKPDQYIRLSIEPYEGKNIYVHKMSQYINKHLKDDLLGAYVHGSLGNYDDIAYSDFDALVILKDEVFDTPKRLSKAALRLSKSLSIMFEFDPLQHHGWFILTETDLKSYPEHYFPLDLFRHAKSLLNKKGLELEFSLRDCSIEVREVFDNMANNIIRKIDTKDFPKNMYQLKSLLSEFMLLPVLYVHARDGKGIYKKDSFEVAKVDFEDENWLIMNEVSYIRKIWDYQAGPDWPGA